MFPFINPQTPGTFAGKDNEGVAKMTALDFEEQRVERLTEHGYNVVYYKNVPYPPFCRPAAIDALRERAWVRNSECPPVFV